MQKQGDSEMTDDVAKPRIILTLIKRRPFESSPTREIHYP